MLAIAAIGLLLGATLRFRFQVLVVVPAVALTWLFDSGDGASYETSLRATLLTAALFVAALQLGHLAGATARSLWPLPRDRAQQ